MMRYLATTSMLILAIMVMSFYLPKLYDRALVKDIEKTHLFYSPEINDFIYTEGTVGFDKDAAAKAEDHHANIAYKDASGRYYSRLEFERALPFIYVRNMERRGHLPLEIDGRILDKKEIDAHRQVLELSAANLPGNRPSEGVWPIFEKDPGQASLVFPDDRFRMTASAMEFISADFNKIDPELTRLFTQALLNRGFIFPARQVAGNFTILKPFDGGVFIIDQNYHVFHVHRDHGQPVVIKTPIDPQLETKHITVVESNLRQFHGLLMDGQNRLHLLTTDNYRLASLPLDDYDPQTMDFKIIFDPINSTAIYSDQNTIRAVVMDQNYQALARYEHQMSRAHLSPYRKVGQFLFPFRLEINTEISKMVSPKFSVSPFYLSVCLPFGLILAALYTFVFYRRWHRPPPWAVLALTAITGFYGLIAGTMLIEK